MSRFWTPEDEAWLIALYPDVQTADLARLFRRTISSVYNAAELRGLKKSPEFLASQQSGRLTKLTAAGNPHRFKKGQRAWNKGLRGVNGTSKTRFRKGGPHPTTRPVGSTRTDSDGLVWVKVAQPNEWKRQDVIAWEKAHGAIPAGKFLRRVKGEFRLVDRAENCRLNSHHTNYPPEISRMIQLRGALNRQINRRNHDKRR